MIKDERLYLSRMDKTMTRDEKLFFLDHINIEEYDIIVDFGGAEGTLVEEIKKVNSNSKAIYFIIDNYFSKKAVPNTIWLGNLTSLNPPKASKVLFILSSVLHELNSDEIVNTYNFCEKYADTIVARDMCFSSKRNNATSKELELYFKLFDSEPKFRDMLKVISSYDTFVLVALYEYLLKYEFENNWGNEVKEFYLCNNIKLFEDIITKHFDLNYEKNYILPYKKKKVQEDFGYVITLPTHRQIILERRNGKLNDNCTT